ncbi:TetR/AcrR family transcriptional regulator [Gordonia sp. NPDC003504]
MSGWRSRCRSAKLVVVSAHLSPRRTEIVDAAIRILERDGVDALSMRALASDLGVGPMTLYYYVPNKAALLSLVVAETGNRIN